jgi:hypothetical protein
VTQASKNNGRGPKSVGARIALTAFLLFGMFAHGNHSLAKKASIDPPYKRVAVSDRVTVETSFTPVPLPATVIYMGKRKYRVEMLPSYQFKGGEILEIAPRQIKAVFPVAKELARPADRADAPKGTVKLQGSAKAGERARTLTGFYTCFSQTFEGKKMVCREQQFYFYADGRVLRGIPAEAPGQLKWELQPPDAVGSYGIDGDTIILTFKDETITWPLKRKNGQVEINGMVADRAPEFAPGIRIVGNYERDEINLVEGKPVTSKKSYSFSADGKVVVTDRNGVVNGTYELSGNDLSFESAGYSKSYLAYPLYLDSGKTKRPERISIGGQLYFLR